MKEPCLTRRLQQTAERAAFWRRGALARQDGIAHVPEAFPRQDIGSLQWDCFLAFKRASAPINAKGFSRVWVFAEIQEHFVYFVIPVCAGREDPAHRFHVLICTPPILY